ncbi:uncharacterized protein LOC127252995 [Andrographis paniculata]|uniref:uncharacterized protein LOC127252995 n=1 Tax=Andrographis paniculata TaxID=175694 RepID=UPI0021E6E4BB|nr:uncharacterized protein LOC127252995 [Andrographis paniculata]
MESHRAYIPASLLILSLISFQFKAIYGDSTVAFVDSPTRQYFRQSSAKIDSFSPNEIGAIASVLLGFAPSSELSDASSSKLNNLLMPNPFDKPRALLMLEVTGVEDSQHLSDLAQSRFTSAMRIKVQGNQRVEIQLPDEVSLFSLNGASSLADCSEKEISDFAFWLGGSYVEDVSKPLNGELVIPTDDGAFLRLHLSEAADKEFATSLVSLITNIIRAKEMHAVLAKGENRPAEIIVGRFDGVQALKVRYGKDGIAQSGLEVLLKSISKAFDSLLEAYQGEIVGVIAQGGPSELELENRFRVTISPRSSPRWLQETTAPMANITEIAEIVFVRRTLAWITGIILVIATLLGIHFLMNMPLTKDTLLYSNVKLD